MRALVPLALAVVAVQAFAAAQTRGTAPAGRRTAPPATRVEAPMLGCPAELGQGASTGRTFCDVLIERDPAEGIIIQIPPHTGDVTLTFDLHNRHTYSEDQVRNQRAYHRYVASIGVLTSDNTLISRAVIASEFRTADDLFDRILGGSGPGGLKAVAPTGVESIVMTIPAVEKSLSILGEKLSVIRVDGKDEFVTAGRPIAVVSNVRLEYRPAAGRGTQPR